MRRAAKRDAAEQPIVDALRAAGFWVELLSQDGIPDLMVGRRGRVGVVLLEVKSADSDRLTPGQIQFFRKTDGSCVARVQTPDEALRVATAELGDVSHGSSDGTSRT